MTRTASISTPLPMIAGECLMRRVASGNRWRVNSGCVRLTEPLRSLGECMVAIERPLEEGSCHVIEHGGWVKIQALTDAVLVVEPAATLRWRGLLHWRRLLPGRALRTAA